MHFHQNNFANRIKSFSLLTHGFTFDEKNDEIRRYLKKIIITAHNLVTNKIKDEDIEFDIYDIVTGLANVDKPYMRRYLEGVDPTNIKDEDYITLNNVLASMMAENSNE